MLLWDDDVDDIDEDDLDESVCFSSTCPLVSVDEGCRDRGLFASFSGRDDPDNGRLSAARPAATSDVETWSLLLLAIAFLDGPPPVPADAAVPVVDGDLYGRN